MPERALLRIAVPNKGSLAEGSAQMLLEAGYRQRSDSKDLVLFDEDNQVEFCYLRPSDISVFVGEGTLDLGITGRDFLLDSGSAAVEVRGLGFGTSRFRFAAPAGENFTVESLAGRRVATTYTGLVKAHLTRLGIESRLIKLDGAVESAIRLGVADAIADVVETGTTLRKAGLEVFGEPILESEAILIRRDNAEPPAGMDGLLRRINGVIVARSFVMMDYDIPVDLLERASEMTPGLESPTVSPLAREGWVAVRAMVPQEKAQLIMDDLWEVGARAILVTDIAACRI